MWRRPRTDTWSRAAPLSWGPLPCTPTTRGCRWRRWRRQRAGPSTTTSTTASGPSARGEVPQLGLETQVEDGVLWVPPNCSSAAGSTSYLDGRGQTPWTLRSWRRQLVPVVHVPVEGGEKRTTYESFEKRLLAGAKPGRLGRDRGSGLSLSVLGRLAGPQMADLDGTRHGTTSFATACSTILSSDHRSPPTAWAQPSKATKLFEHILAEHLETGVCLLEASENGKQVIECFEELEQDGCEILRHMKVYGNWDSVLYELRLMTRAISATPRFCEMYYI